MIVIGIGNELRRDDGAGPAVIAELHRRHLHAMTLAVSDGEPGRLIDLWAGADLAVIIDAVQDTTGEPGRIHEHTSIDDTRPHTSSHALGLETATRLGQALDRMPHRLHVFLIEGTDFDYGPGLHPPVARAVAQVADRITALNRSVPTGEADRGGAQP